MSIHRLLASQMVAPSEDPRDMERLNKLFIKDLVLLCRIGAYPHEHLAPQRVRINVEVRVREPDRPVNDELGNVLSYDSIAKEIRALAAKGHINLVETLAEEIAGICLADRRAEEVRVAVEKLDIMPDAAAVGVEIERRRTSSRASAASIYPLPQAAGWKDRSDG